jgi:hypothetical protein
VSIKALRWDEEACLQALVKVAAELGRAPSVAEYNGLARGREDLPSLTTIVKRCGGWSAALRAAGLEPARKRWDEEACRRALVKAAAELGQTPTFAEYLGLAPGREDLPSIDTIVKWCGGWSAALRAAGLELAHRRWDEEACLQALVKAAAELGQTPTFAEYLGLAPGREDLPSIDTIVKWCGGWSAARDAAGLKP